MEEIAIKVNGLWKGYALGKTKSASIIESIRGFRLGQSLKEEGFWALRNVNFEIEKGKAVGIIGKNGAGKSTLLKILSRITYPTRGSIEINGRVSSLLEVGTGFHPELTGRENVFLNGTLLGMKRKEVKARFDEIVDFSGVEKFIDTPVKHYSSGMKVRLAFAVAAHLDPDILIIDEVLAVGDAEFQKKCLGKMEDVTGQGRTVLFVSHNLGAVKTLCRDGILLGQGQVLCHSNVNEVMAQYNQYLYAIEVTTKRANGRFDLKMHPEKTYDLEFGLQDVEVLVNGKNADTIESGSELEFRVGFKLDFDLDQIVLGFIVRDESMQPVIGINNIMQNVKLALNGAKEGYISVSFKELLIYRRGKFSVDLFLNDGVKSFDIVRNAFWFQVEEADVYHSGKPPEGELNLFFQPGIKFSIG